MSPISPSVLALILGASALLGVVMIKVGLWPRRRGSERRCRRCNYVVDNISSERCPECGSMLAGRGTVVGQRHRHARIWLSGVLLLFLALTYGGMEVYRRVDWYQHKPTRWVMKDLEARDGKTEERAWWQLMRRQNEGSLSKYWEEKLADVAQKDYWAWAILPEPKWRQNIARRRGELSIMFLWAQYDSGKLTPAQTEQFFRQLAATHWKTRPIVLVGQDVPYRMEGERYLPEGWWMRYGLLSDPRGALIGGGGGLTGSHLGNAWVAKGSAKKTAGEQDVEIPYFIEYFRGKILGYEEAEVAKPAWRGEFVHRAKIKVLEKRNEEFLKVVDAPDLKEQIKASLVLEPFGNQPRDRAVVISSKGLPINCAFEVVGRVDGREYSIMNVAFRKGIGGGGMGWHLEGDSWFVQQIKTRKVDLIFRSKPELAERTVDMFEVWQGEVTLEGVSVFPKQ